MRIAEIVFTFTASRVAARRGPGTVILLVQVAQPILVAREQSFATLVALYRDGLLTIGASDGRALAKDAAVCRALGVAPEQIVLPSALKVAEQSMQAPFRILSPGVQKV